MVERERTDIYGCKLMFILHKRALVELLSASISEMRTNPLDVVELERRMCCLESTNKS